MCNSFFNDTQELHGSSEKSWSSASQQDDFDERLEKIRCKFFNHSRSEARSFAGFDGYRKLKKILKEIEDGRIKIEEITTRIPSPFSFNLTLQGNMDILKIEEKHEFLQRMHELIMGKIGLEKENQE